MTPEQGAAIARAALAAARAQDPAIETTAGLAIAHDCLERLAGDPSLAAPELARRCVADDPQADASWVNYLAQAVRARVQRPGAAGPTEP